MNLQYYMMKWGRQFAECVAYPWQSGIAGIDISKALTIEQDEREDLEAPGERGGRGESNFVQWQQCRQTCQNRVCAHAKHINALLTEEADSESVIASRIQLNFVKGGGPEPTRSGKVFLRQGHLHFSLEPLHRFWVHICDRFGRRTWHKLPAMPAEGQFLYSDDHHNQNMSRNCGSENCNGDHFHHAAVVMWKCLHMPLRKWALYGSSGSAITSKGEHTAPKPPCA